ncbi:MAG: hypothetical protein ACTSPD_13050 [Promethearchaeota archaeon]
MSAILSWIKKELEYLKDSFIEIIMGFIFFILAFSGLGVALLLRYLEFNGNIIASVGIVTEMIALFLCYFIFKGYLKLEEEVKQTEKKISKKR